MKIDRPLKAVPLAALSLVLLLSSCAAPTLVSAPGSTAPSGAPSASPSNTRSPATSQSADFTTVVTADLKPFVDAGKAWAIKTKGEIFFAGNKAVSVESTDLSADIKVTVVNLNDGSTVGTAAVKRIAQVGESENDFPTAFSIVRHERKDFLSVTQMGVLPTRDGLVPESVSDVQVTFLGLDDPAKISSFGQEDAYAWGEDPSSQNDIRHMVPLTGDTDGNGEPESFYATPVGITKVKGPSQNVIALTQGEPLVQGQLGIGAYEMRVPGGWDVLNTLSGGEKDPLGEMQVLAVSGNFISFDYNFAIEKPYHGSYLVDLEHRKIHQTSSVDRKADGYTVKGLQGSLDGDFLVMKDSAYNKRTGKLVSFRGTERILLGVANKDGTRAYGTRAADQIRVLVDLTTKMIQDVENAGDETSELPDWITPENTVVFRDHDILSGVRTN